MSDAPSHAGLRVLALDLWRRYGAWPQRRAVLVEGLRALQPDLVAFEEAILTDGYDQARDLLGPGMHVGACVRAFDRPVDGVWASDHFGVVADLAAPAARG